MSTVLQTRRRSATRERRGLQKSATQKSVSSLYTDLTSAGSAAGGCHAGFPQAARQRARGPKAMRLVALPLSKA